MNNNVTFVPVAARPWTGISAASLGASLLSELAPAQTSADRQAYIAPMCVAADAPRQQVQTAPAMPEVGQPSTTATSKHLHAIGAAAPRGSQTGSLPAWDPA